MNPIAKKAYETWRNQRARCNRPSSVNYKYYGGKGHKVEYSSREFLGWFIENYPGSEKDLKNYVVGRINHEKNYSLDNIRFETKTVSTNEMLNRYQNRRPILAVSEDDDYSMAFSSAYHASKILNISTGHISGTAQRRSLGVKSRKPKCGYQFYYMEV